MRYTLGTAAKATGKSKTTIQRAVTKGLISAEKGRGGEYSIDPTNRILPETQNLVFKTYIGLFLEGLLKGDLAAMRVFRGGEQPILQSGNSLVIDDIKKRLRVCPMSAEFSQFLAPPNNYVFFKFLDDVPKFGAAKDVGTLSFQREKVYRLRWCYAPI